MSDTTATLIGEVHELRVENEALRAALDPGKAPAIIAAMWDAAVRLGHCEFSAKHALTYLVEEIERLRADVAHLDSLLHLCPRCGAALEEQAATR